jgi:hypothetical protein
MFDRKAQLELLLDLETRQDDLLLRLEDLDKRVAKTLAEYTASRQPICVAEQCPAIGGH